VIEGFWLRWQFALHGHSVAMSREEYDDIKKSWTTSAKESITIQLAVVGPDMCIAFLDKNKLIQITCIPFYPTTSSSGPTWYDTSLAPCPIMDIEAFMTNLKHPDYQQSLRDIRKTNAIYFEIAGSKNNNLWNGIGTSHAVEILHLAGIHPEEKTYVVLRSRDKRERLEKALHDFFSQIRE